MQNLSQVASIHSVFFVDSCLVNIGGIFENMSSKVSCCRQIGYGGENTQCCDYKVELERRIYMLLDFIPHRLFV